MRGMGGRVKQLARSMGKPRFMMPNARAKLPPRSGATREPQATLAAVSLSERIKGTSPTRYGIEVPRLSFRVFNLKERGSHARYYDDYHKTLVAIANKHARMIWAMLAKDEGYDPNAWQRLSM